MNCSTLRERVAGSPPNTSQVSLSIVDNAQLFFSRLLILGWFNQRASKYERARPLSQSSWPQSGAAYGARKLTSLRARVRGLRSLTSGRAPVLLPRAARSCARKLASTARLARCAVSARLRRDQIDVDASRAPLVRGALSEAARSRGLNALACSAQTGAC